jgi:hypothetical protein
MRRYVKQRYLPMERLDSPDFADLSPGRTVLTHIAARPVDGK